MIPLHSDLSLYINNFTKFNRTKHSKNVTEYVTTPPSKGFFNQNSKTVMQVIQIGSDCRSLEVSNDRNVRVIADKS